MNYVFVTSCVGWGGLPGTDPGRDIQQMVDQAVDVTRATFLKHVNRRDLRAVSLELGYAEHASQGLTMAGDWHVSYHRSHFLGVPCYYFVWSAIEHIFVDRNQWNRVLAAKLEHAGSD